ncbi:MAG: phytoene desaturase family protein [Sporichthyaceae bacterium]
MARVVVVGAGLSGLAAAARLARLKHDVVVCERAGGPGGQAGRYERDGFAFDTGPTTLTMPASYRDLFVKTGKTTPLENYLDLQPVPSTRWTFLDGTRLDIPNASQGGRMHAIGAVFGADAARGWEAFLTSGEAVWTRFRKGFLDGPPALSGKRFRVPAEEKALLSELNPAENFHKLTERHLAQWPQLWQAAWSWPLRLGSDPYFASAGTAIWPWLEATFGLWNPVGGVRALVDVVAERARSRGAELRYETEVVGLELHDGKVVGVRLGNGTLRADVVVAAVDDRQLAQWSGATTSDGEPSHAATTMLLALREGDDRPFLELLFAEPGQDTVLVVTKAEAPAGHTAYTVTANDPGQGGLGPSAVLAHLDRAGFDVSRRLLWHERLETPAGLAGPALHGRTGLIRRPNTTGVAGLFHVGASAHPGPGIAFAPLGAALVADAVGRAR